MAAPRQGDQPVIPEQRGGAAFQLRDRDQDVVKDQRCGR